MENQPEHVTRRKFLYQAGILGASATISSLVAVACTSSAPTAPSATASSGAAPTAGSAAATAPAAAPAAATAAQPAAATAAQPAAAASAAPAVAKAGEKHTLVWVTQALGEWQAPMLTGYRDFLDMAGWEFVGLGDARYSIENHTREVTNAIQRKPDVLVTSLENSQAIGPLLLDARKQGIKVMIGDQTSLEWGAANNVASHSEDSLRWGAAMGYEAAKQAATKLNKKEGVFIMGNGNPGAALIENRIKGGQNGVAKYNQENGTNFTTDVFPDKAFDDLTESVSKYAAKYDSVRDTCVGCLGIAGPNNSAFSKMMKDKGLAPGSVIVGGGHDGQPEVAAMQDGFMQFMYVRNTYGMGYIAGSQAWQWVERGFQPADYLVSFELTYPENLDALKARDEIWTSKAKEYGFMK